MTVEQLQVEIDALPESDFDRLRRWFIDRDWERWDRQLEADVEAGKLDLLIEEATTAKSQSLLTSSRCTALHPSSGIAHVSLTTL